MSTLPRFSERDHESAPQHGPGEVVRGPARRTLLVVNLYYAPDVASTGQLAADICRSLARRGYAVHVIAAQPCYTSGQLEAPGREVLDGVEVHRVPMGRARGRERLVVRVAGYLRFLIGAFGEARRVVKAIQPDAVLTFHNPPFVGLIGAYLARRHGLSFTYALYDIHPDVLVATRWGWIPRPLLWIWERVNAWILKHAGTIVVLGEGMKSTLVDGGRAAPGQVRVIPMWGRPELEPASRPVALRRELGAGDDEMLILCAGNMGVMHPLEAVLDAARELRDAPVRFLFLGDGARRGALMRRAAAERLERVSFLPFQSEERFTGIVAASDACVVGLYPGLEKLAVPSRAYTILSAGRAIVTLMAPEADIARLVRDAGCGWNVADGDELAVLLRSLAGRPEEFARRGERGRQLYEKRFQRERIIDEYARALER